MASQMLGRCACPECGFHAAHVKINIDKEGKQPYRHCPECGAQYFPRNNSQGEMLREKMRPEGTAPVSAPPAELPKPTPAQVNEACQRAAEQDAQQQQPSNALVPRPMKWVFGQLVPA